jgi:hypothetical protein
MAVEPSAQISSSIDLGLASGVPELYQKPEDRSLYQLIVQTAQNILSSIETYCGLTQKPMTQWSLLSPSATLRRQNLGRLYCISGEAIVYGALVNLYNNAGVLTARNANSSTGRSAHGQGILPVTGVSPADRMFLAPVNGQMQIGPDLAAGHIEQFIGIGIATNLVYIDITMGSWIQH